MNVKDGARMRLGALRRPSWRNVVGLVGAAVLLIGCGGQVTDDPAGAFGAADDTDIADVDTPDDTGAVDERDEDTEDDGGPDGADAGDVDASDQDASDASPERALVDPAQVGADELGFVPVLMYHRLREDGGSSFDLTPEELRGELTWLFENGYSPVTTVDLARGSFDIPAGRTPVVLTFDDSTREQAWLDDDGELAEESAAGILIDVAAEYDDVDPVASFYVITSSLFGGTADGPDILTELHTQGMEIGSHTHEHSNLGLLDDEGVIAELAEATSRIQAIIPDAEVATLSLPFGANPEHRELLEGDPQLGYEFDGVLLVGSGPAHSPYADQFEGLAIPRVRSSPSWTGGDADWGSRFWLEQMDSSETYRRFVSDGDASRISFPEEYVDDLDARFGDAANPY